MIMPFHMLKYREELSRLGNIVQPTAQLFRNKSGEFYRWKQEWESVAEGIDACIVDGKYSVNAGNTPECFHPLSVHFKSAYLNILREVNQTVSQCKEHLQNMESMLLTMKKMDSILPFGEPSSQTMMRIHSLAKTKSYTFATNMPQEEISMLRKMDMDTVTSMNVGKSKFRELSDKEWGYFKDASDDQSSVFRYKYKNSGRNEEALGFYVLRNASEERAYNRYPKNWNILACGTENVEGASVLMIQSILQHISVSSTKCLTWSVDKTH